MSISKRAHAVWDQERLREAALDYLGRYASNEARLRLVLKRRLMRQDIVIDAAWTSAIDQVVADCRALGLIDDARFAGERAASLRRAGKSARAIRHQLTGRGVSADDINVGLDAADSDLPDREAADLLAALRLAERRKLGPFGPQLTDGAAVRQRLERRHYATLMRAGHAPGLAAKLLKSDFAALADWLDRLDVPRAEWPASLDGPD